MATMLWAKPRPLSALATALWLVKGADTPAEFDGLRDKRVVVVCRPVSSSLYAHPGVAKDISRQVSRLLAANVRKIEVVDQRKVDEWIDSNNWDEYSEIGKALEAQRLLAAEGARAAVVNHPFVNRPDVDTLAPLVERAQGRLVTIEDHQIVSGFGAQIAHALGRAGVKFVMRSLGIPGAFGRSAYVADHLYARYGMTGEALAAAARELLGR